MGHAVADFALKGRNSDPGVTNVRNTASAHWRRWLGRREPLPGAVHQLFGERGAAGRPRPPVWFAFDESRPLAFFAGIWTRWTSVRKVKEGETTNDLFAFLTTEPNTEVGAIHPKAMPVILTTPEELEAWMTAPPRRLSAAAAAARRPRAPHRCPWREGGRSGWGCRHGSTVAEQGSLGSRGRCSTSCRSPADLRCDCGGDPLVASYFSCLHSSTESRQAHKPTATGRSRSKRSAVLPCPTFGKARL